MIRLSRLNGTGFILNAELIRSVEECPDTLIMLYNHETLMVAESVEEVVQRVLAYHQCKNLVPQLQHAPCDLGLLAEC